MGISLTKIKGVGPSTERLLKAHSIQSVEDLVAAALKDISIIPSFGEVRARQLQQAAINVLASRQSADPHLSNAKPVSISEPTVVMQSPSLPPTTNFTPSVLATSHVEPPKNGIKAVEPKDLTVLVVTTPQQTEELASQLQTSELVMPINESESTAPRGRIRRRRRGPQVNNGNTPGGIVDTKSPKHPTGVDPRPARPPHSFIETEPRTRSATAPLSREPFMTTQAQINTCTMALFCDFENIALGTRDAHYAAFDIQKVLERLLLKGNIVVRKAYCDWERYKEFKAPMHEAAFELIEIPHVRQSGKNSADIRMVVDALDLCYTKQHLDTFVIISGDSDFTSLVTKLRENNKTVIGVGVKKSTSDLFTSNCDEFIFYDDLLRESEKEKQRRRQHDKGAAITKSVPKVNQSQEELKMQEALDIVLETVEDLFEERGGDEKVWGSMVKQAVKRRKPGFNERYHGFRTFSKLLEEAATRGLLRIQHDEKSGGYIIEGFNQDD